MKNKTLKTVAIVILCICTAFVINKFAKGKSSYIEDLSEYPVSYMHTSTPLFDFQNKSLCVGFSDNTFVGKVLDIYYCGAYDDKYYESGDILIPRNSLPCTKYEVVISESIKGQLKKDEIVTVYKFAGITKEKKLSIMRGDVMPVKGQEYIFLTKTDENGSHIITDPLGNIALTEEGFNVIREDVSVAYEENLSTTAVEKEEAPKVATTVTPDGRVVTTQVYDLSDESDSFRYYSNNMTKEEVIESYREAFKTQRNPIEELKK